MNKFLMILSFCVLGSAFHFTHAEGLSAEDQKILDRGRYSTGQYVTGGVLGSVLGFGIGHAVQERYLETGWIFTVTEVSSYAVLLTGYLLWLSRDKENILDYCPKPKPLDFTLMIAGGLVFTGFRIWEIIDLWTEPAAHNRRYDELRARDMKKTEFFLSPSVAVNGDVGVGFGVNF